MNEQLLCDWVNFRHIDNDTAALMLDQEAQHYLFALRTCFDNFMRIPPSETDTIH